MEDGSDKKLKSRREDLEGSSRRTHHHRSSDKERHHREKSRSEREKSLDSSDSQNLDNREKDHSGKHRSKDKDKDRKRGRDDKKREKDRERDRDRDRERVKEKEKKERERERERDKREREKERERERERDRKEREKEKQRRKRHRESPERKSPDEGSEEKKPRVESKAEPELDEQVKLDEEMEKRRRRVQEWQELKRKKEEEAEREKLAGTEPTNEPKSGKVWTLEGEESDDDDEDPKGMEVDGGDEPVGGNMDTSNGDDQMGLGSDNGVVAQPENGAEGEEIDPLDAFMNALVVPEAKENGSEPMEKNKGSMGRIIPGEDSDTDDEAAENDGSDDMAAEDENDDEFMKRVKKTKAEKLALVDHSKIDYPHFRKNFYIEVKEISLTSPEEVDLYRRQNEFKIYGKGVPKPIKAWNQTGLTTKMLDIIRKLGFEKPMPIQAQALPVIMSGRDCIGIAKTGSGKTIAFVLPMLRHIKDQPPVVTGDGPIGLIMAPTRELVQQIHSDIRKFTKSLGIRCVPVYGGAGVAQQISELKRGAEIVVCTPGRMIDILCTSAGKITNLRRVTYLVMDEADRMFDMGFEPQITRIVQNIRPERQTVLFSATFPRQVEILARGVLNNPVQIQVGGRSVVNKDITQLVEVRPEGDRFFRLLELLGEWYEKGKILVFVQSQTKCDMLFKEMLRHGYPCLSLHGGNDQTDRESTVADFKSNVCNLLIATSIAARGLDVRDLELVVNYDIPNHYEDYVHRVGRTGRAGRKGLAVTFISEEEEEHAPDLVRALELSEQVVPEDLRELANRFMAKVKSGLAQRPGGGYGGTGFKFNEEEEESRRAVKKAQAKEYGFEEEEKSDSGEEDGDDNPAEIRKATGPPDFSQAQAQAQAAAALAQAQAQAAAAAAAVAGGGPAAALVAGDRAVRAAALAAAMNLQHNLAKIAAPEHFVAELEINDFPQNARWKVTHKDTLLPISEWTKAAITTRGKFFGPGMAVTPGDRKLYLFIEGPTERSVRSAKAELKRVLEEFTNQAMAVSGGSQTGKYSVV